MYSAYLMIKLGTTDITTFDIDTSRLTPVAVPLRRIPVHQREIVEKLLEKYTELGLIETFDSPYR